MPATEKGYVERTNPWNGEVSPSGADTGTCPRKFFLSKVLGISEDIPAIYLQFGSAVHKAVEIFYKNRELVERPELKLLVMKGFAKYLQDSNCTAFDNIRNPSTGMRVLDMYMEHYYNDKAIFVPEMVECNQWLELPNGGHVLMKIDRVRNNNGYYTVIDTKTSSRPLTDYYFKQYDNALATSLYFWCVASVLGQCDNVQIDGIKLPPKDDVNETLVRRTYTRTEKQITDALDTVCYFTDNLMEALAVPRTVKELFPSFPCNQHNCLDYGGCRYASLCKHGWAAPSLRCDFKATNANGREIMRLAKEEQFDKIDDMLVVECKPVKKEDI